VEVGLLYSGGKDSTLAALLLDGLADVTLLCGTFDITDDHEHARAAAQAVGFPSRRLDLDPAVADDAIEQMLADGYPRNGIQQVHEHALEEATALSVDAVADGTRRDDRTPTVDRPLAQSLEDRHGVAHLAPLAGIGRAAIDDLAEAHLVVDTGPSEAIPKGDYETELRARIAAEYGQERVETLFPDHTQSRVTGRKD
jgi:predicted subunit of tRNA(5-methylaminomethyl-2-thiouridylate) methyltransferase